MQTRQRRDRKKESKQKEARKGLAGLLKRLRQACGSFSSADEWVDFVQESVQPLLSKHAAALSLETRQRIERAARLVDSSRAGIDYACKVLESEVESVILGLPAPVPVPLYQVLLGCFVAAAVVIGTATLALNLMAATVHISNRSCESIDLTTYQVLNYVPGFDLPPAIDMGGESVLTIAPVSITIDTRQEGEFTVDAFGVPVTGEIQGLTSVQLDGTTEIFGFEFPLALKPRAEHSLQLNCR